MTSKRDTETVTAPRRTLDLVREHLAKNGPVLGRPDTISQFVAEACRKLVQLDLEWMQEHDLPFQSPGTGEGPSKDPPSKKQGKRSSD